MTSEEFVKLLQICDWMLQRKWVRVFEGARPDEIAFITRMEPDGWVTVGYGPHGDEELGLEERVRAQQVELWDGQ